MQKRTVRILKGIGITLVVLGLIYVVATAVSFGKLRHAYANLEKAGRPMTSDSVIPPAVADTDNAALLYESAILLLKAQPADGQDLLSHMGDLSGTFLTESLDADKRAELQQLLQQDVVRQALSVVEEGTRRPACRFDYDYKAGFSMLLPHLSGWRSLARILGARAVLEAQAGRSQAAWDLAVTQLKSADAMRKDPILISQLVRFASIRTSCKAIQKISETAPPDNEQYRVIDQLLQDYEDNTPLVLAFDGERLLGGEWAFNLLARESGRVLALTGGDTQESELGAMIMGLYSAFKPLSLADHAAYLRILDEYTRSAREPYLRGEQGALDKQMSRLHLVTSMIVPALGRVKEVYWEMVAEMRVTRTGVALLKDKKADGSFPNTLQEPALKQTDDPFSKERLVYRSGPDGFVLYSVGPDGKDNGGAPKQKNQKTDWDIVWKFPGGSSGS